MFLRNRSDDGCYLFDHCAGRNATSLAYCLLTYVFSYCLVLVQVFNAQTSLPTFAKRLLRATVHWLHRSTSVSALIVSRGKLNWSVANAQVPTFLPFQCPHRGLRHAALDSDHVECWEINIHIICQICICITSFEVAKAAL